MKATSEQVDTIINHPNTVSRMTRGKSLKSFLFSLSRHEADELINRLEDGEEVKVGK